jgi:hypothetical protein
MLRCSVSATSSVAQSRDLEGGAHVGGARQRVGELTRDHAEEVAVVLVEVVARAGAEHERGGGRLAARPGDR